MSLFARRRQEEKKNREANKSKAHQENHDRAKQIHAQQPEEKKKVIENGAIKSGTK